VQQVVRRAGETRWACQEFSLALLEVRVLV